MKNEPRFPCRPTGEAIDVAAAWARISKRYPRIIARLHEIELAEGVRE